MTLYSEIEKLYDYLEKEVCENTYFNHSKTFAFKFCFKDPELLHFLLIIYVNFMPHYLECRGVFKNSLICVVFHGFLWMLNQEVPCLIILTFLRSACMHPDCNADLMKEPPLLS